MRYWLTTVWPPDIGQSHDNTKIWAQDRNKKALELLGQGDLVFIYELKTDPNEKYPWLFCWDDIPGQRFINFLKTKFYISFVVPPKIVKSAIDNTVYFSDDNTKHCLRLNQINEEEATLTFDDKKSIEVYAEEEEGKRQIYSKSTNTTIPEGRFGIIALVESLSKKFEKHNWGPTEYESRPSIYWKWEAKAKIVREDGFVPQKIVCKILGKKNNYYFRGWGINEISEDQFKRLKEYYYEHSDGFIVKK